MQKFCKLSPYISDIYKLSGVDHSGLFIYYVHSAKVLSTNREQKAAFCYFWLDFFFQTEHLLPVLDSKF